jgi:hypothetical protein
MVFALPLGSSLPAAVQTGTETPWGSGWVDLSCHFEIRREKTHMNCAKISRFLALGLVFGSCLAPCANGAAGKAVTIRYVSPGGSDSGSCANPSQPCRSLQFAVDHAVSGDEVRLAGGDYTIQVAPIADIRVGLTLRGGYTLTNWETADKTAHPTALKVSTLCGEEAAIEAGALERVSIQDLDILGCGIRSSGDLLVERVSIQNGSIYHGAGANIPVTLSEVTIQGGGFTHASGANSLATLTHIMISNSPRDGIREVSGGGIALSDAQIVNCAGMGIVFATGAVPSSVTHAWIHGNQVGIETRSGGILTLDQVTIEDNRGRGVIDKSAGMMMTHVTIQGNHAIRDDANDDLGDGGGIYTLGKGSTLTDVVIRENTADGNGGGIYDKGGKSPITRSTLAGNQAGGSGGGIWSAGTPDFIDSAITGNQAAAGGGIFCHFCGVSLTNSAVSMNAAGGIVAERGKVVLLNSLVVGNSGLGVDDLLEDPPDDRSILSFDNSLLALNTGGNCAVTALLEGSHNLSSDASCSFSGESNRSQIDPQLSGLLANGFYNMSPSSPAVDQGNPATCPTNDYRGIPRPLDGNGDGVAVCDIGPLEVGWRVLLPMVVR